MTSDDGSRQGARNGRADHAGMARRGLDDGDVSASDTCRPDGRIVLPDAPGASRQATPGEARTSDLNIAAAAHALVAGALPPGALTSGALTSGALTSGALTAGSPTSAIALAVPAALAAYAAAVPGGTLNGAGLTIGILSDSFDITNGGTGEAADIAAGDLPPASQIHILQDGTAGQDEGRAMAQLIYDIAPGATIDFYTGTDSEQDFATGIGSLVAAGCNVIVDDVIYTDEPFYQNTGVVTQAVENAIAQGVDYFTSASNSGSNFYESVFTAQTFKLPGIGTRTVSDADGTASPYESVVIYGTDPTLDLTLQWTQPFGSNVFDLGVALYSLSSGVYTLVGDFDNVNGRGAATITADPVLQIETAETISAGTYYIAVYDAAGAVAPGTTFKLISFSDSELLLDGPGAGVGSGAVLGHELAPGVNTVAAVNYNETPAQGYQGTPPVEGFSAVGPGKTYIDAAGKTLAAPVTDDAPDFAATDATYTTVIDRFFGTSAAAPNAAAVGLLMLQADGRLVAGQVTTLLERSAIPTASTISGGAGLIQADTAVAGAIAAAAAPLWTMQGTGGMDNSGVGAGAVSGSTLWSSAGNWSDDRTPGAGDAVQITDGIGLFTAAYVVSDDVSASVASLTVDGGAYLPAMPDLVVQAGQVLATGSLVLGAGSIALAGTLSDAGPLAKGSAAGTIALGAAGVLRLGGGAAGGTIAFGSAAGGAVVFTATDTSTLTSGLAAAVTGFAAGDTIDFAGVAEAQVAAVQVSGAAAALVNAAGTTLAALNVTGAFSALGFAPDAKGGTELVACYLAGTRIATPQGECAIEHLDIGDKVITVCGRARPIRWIGRRRYDAVPPGDSERQPVRLTAGCLGAGLPRRDLYVSPRHALLLNGMLVPANGLLDRPGIARAALAGEIVYFHIELDTHDAIFAEGAAAETFADTGNRHMFDNAAEFAALYPGPAGLTHPFCAPRLDDAAA
jgi:hypothetical protein